MKEEYIYIYIKRKGTRKQAKKEEDDFDPIFLEILVHE
jgi:hypothetical protein